MGIEVKRTDDMIVVDSTDVERAQMLSMKREKEHDQREEQVIRVAPDETVVIPPKD